MGDDKDGEMILTLLDNDLEVVADFYPSRGNGSPINLDYINSLFAQSKIVFGVQHDAIHEAFRSCVEEREIVRDVVVAKGIPPVNEVQEYLRINPYLVSKNKEREKNETVDHRARSAFTIVKKGQRLAKLKPMRQGKEGTNVHGESVPFKVTRPIAVTAGSNTQMEGEFLVSSIHGQLVQIRGELNVNKSLVIKGSVGYATGNIIFPGDVEISGTVSDGFKIYSGGSITIKQTFDVTDAVAKKDLIVAGGIIGRGMARIKVGGSVKTKFIENCHIAVRNDIYVESDIINSRVFTLGALEMGEKSKIVGGEISAVKGVHTGGLGKKTGKAAKIQCGVDFIMEREKEKNNNVLRLLASQLQRLKELMEDPGVDDEKKKKMEIVLIKLCEEQQNAQNKLMELLGKLNVCEDAVVEVTGEVVQGTLIGICQAALYVTDPLNKVRIRLGKESQRLITEKIS